MGKPASTLIGKPKHDLLTPALLLDLDSAKHNIGVVANRLSGKAGLRPHFKSHKCAQIARLQVDAGGVIGFTVATLWEALALCRAGFDDLLIANQIVGREKCRLLAQACRRTRVAVAVDSLANAEQLSAAAQLAGSAIGVLIEVDTGMGRCGVRSQEEAHKVAMGVSQLPGLSLRGVTGYEGHCVLEPDRSVRTEMAGTAMAYLVGIANSLRDAGLPIEIVSAGGTGTWDITGCNPSVTEIQAGSYVLLDATRGAYLEGLEYALTVLSTVISRQGTTLVLDVGRKAISPEFTLPRIVGYTDDQVVARRPAEEHLVCDVSPDCPLKVGDVVELIPGYAPLTVNLHDDYHVVQNGVVVDIWPILARGAGWTNAQ